MKTSEQLDQIGAALSLAQAELSTAKKDSSGYGYNYSDLASVLATAKPVLAANGLSVTQLVGNSTDKSVSLSTILLHKSGQFISTESSIEIPEMNKINVTQKIGAAISYLRRYSLQAILGMASEDTDATSQVAQTPAKTVSIAANNNVVLGDGTTPANIAGAPPKLTDAQANATVKAPSFSRNKKPTSSNDLGI